MNILGSPRPGQLDYAARVELAIRRRDPVALEAPCGMGKSWGYLQGWISAGAPPLCIATGLRSLQDQLVADIRSVLPHVKVADLRGASNYPCCARAVDTEDEDVDDESAAHERHGQWPDCEYARARVEALDADVVITNGAKLIVEAQFSDVGPCRHKFSGDEPLDEDERERQLSAWDPRVDPGGAFRPVVSRAIIVDEAHTLHDLARLVARRKIGTTRSRVAVEAELDGAQIEVAPGELDAAWCLSRMGAADLDGARGLLATDGPFAAMVRRRVPEIIGPLRTVTTYTKGDKRAVERIISRGEKLLELYAGNPNLYGCLPEAMARAVRRGVAVKEIENAHPAAVCITLEVVDGWDHVQRAIAGHVAVITSATLPDPAVARWLPQGRAVPQKAYPPVYRPEQTTLLQLYARPVWSRDGAELQRLRRARAERIWRSVTEAGVRDANTLILTSSYDDTAIYDALAKSSGLAVFTARQREVYAQRAATSGGNVLIGPAATLGAGLDLPGRLCTMLVIDRLPKAPPDSPEWVAYERFFRAGVLDIPGREIAEGAALDMLVRQAIGRLIRSPEDTGTLILGEARLRRYID